MKRASNEQSGFSVLEILLVVVVVGVLAGASWVVYQHVKTSATTTKAASSPNQQTTQPSPTVAYLTITQWGIKLPLSDSIKDAYYVPSTTNVDANGVPQTVWIGMASLNANGCDISSGDAAGNQITPLGAIIRVAPTAIDNATGDAFTTEYPGVTIGSYYYAFKDLTKLRTCAPTATLQSIASQFSAEIKNATTN